MIPNRKKAATPQRLLISKKKAKRWGVADKIRLDPGELEDEDG